MKHILFLTWKDLKHPRAGGAERVVYEYAKRLVKEWNQITWFASWFDNSEMEEEIDSIKIIRKYNINTIYFFARFWYKDFIKNNKVDIIIDEAGGIPLLSPLYEKNIPIYFFIHHIGEEEFKTALPFPFNFFLKKFAYWTFSLYKKYPTITVSNSTKEELENNFWFQNVTVVENSTNIIPIQKINFENKKNEIVFLWRLTSIKRVEDSIFAFEKFLQKKPEYFLNIIGNKQEKKYVDFLEKYVREKGLQEKIKFIDYSKENVEKYLSQSKIMLVTSKKEWFWLIVLEGNSYGLPVFSYDVAGLRDSTKDGKNWYLIEDGNFEQMAEKMFEILSDDEKYKQISISSLEYIKNFPNWDEQYKKFKNIIKL